MMHGFAKLNPLSRWMFIVIAVSILYIFGRMIEPFVLTIVTAIIFTVLFSHVDRWLALKVGSKKLSAALVVLGVFLTVLLPIGLFAAIIVQQATEVLQTDLLQTAPDIFRQIMVDLRAFVPPVIVSLFDSLNVGAFSTSIVRWLQQNIGSLLAGGFNFVLQLFLFFAFFYYFLTQKDAIRKEIYELSPFRDKLDQGIISRISSTIRGVMVGAIIIAFIQAGLAALGLTIFGVPKGILWGSFALIAAQIPMVGVSLIMVPAIAYLVISGMYSQAIGLTIWSATVVGLVDNFLSPILVGRRTKMPELFVLISVLGGLKMFGPIGFVIGPVVLACVLVLRDLYRSGNLS